MTAYKGQACFTRWCRDAGFAYMRHCGSRFVNERTSTNTHTHAYIYTHRTVVSTCGSHAYAHSRRVLEINEIHKTRVSLRHGTLPCRVGDSFAQEEAREEPVGVSVGVRGGLVQQVTLLGWRRRVAREGTERIIMHNSCPSLSYLSRARARPFNFCGIARASLNRITPRRLKIRRYSKNFTSTIFFFFKSGRFNKTWNLLLWFE